METNLIDEAHRIEAAAHAYADKSGRSQDVYDLIPWGFNNPSGYVVDYPDFDPERCVLHEIIAQALYFGRKVVEAT